MKKSPLEHFHGCQALPQTSQPQGWHPGFPGEEIIEANGMVGVWSCCENGSPPPLSP